MRRRQRSTRGGWPEIGGAVGTPWDVYVNPVLDASKPSAFSAAVVTAAAATLALACSGDTAHIREPAVHLRLRVDTVRPTPEQVEPMKSLGRNVFHASCAGCHMPAGGGQSIAPDLTTSPWSARASYGALVHFLSHGADSAKSPGTRHPGTAQLTPLQLRAVALFIEPMARRDPDGP
ncbi:MAG: c-type cytochrome [Gemmatimonadales bacterium]